MITVAIYTIGMMLSELLMRRYYKASGLRQNIVTAILWFIVLLCIKYTSTTMMLSIELLFISLAILINNLHYAFYKNWMGAAEYFLLFDNIGDVLLTCKSVLKSLIVPLLWSIAEIVFLVSIVYFRDNTYWYADVAYLVFAAYYISMPIINKKLIRDGLRPPVYFSKLEAFSLSQGAFWGRILPQHIFKYGGLPEVEVAEPNIISEPKVDNIMWIVGESQNTTHMSAFGYDVETTPFLKRMADQSVLKKTYAAGTMTAIVVPMLFNAIGKPSGIFQVASGRTNLYRLAKQQNFNTAFHSSPADQKLGWMSGVGLKWIDQYTNSKHSGYGAHEDMLDRKLLEVCDFDCLTTGRHFVTLHQRGAHIPYGYGFEPYELPFGEETLSQRYDNAVLATDVFIENVYNRMKTLDNDRWILIYTSDHGDQVTEDKYGHGYFDDEVNVVPTFIYTPNKALLASIESRLSQYEFMTHHQLSTLLIELMGYDMNMSNGSEAYINGVQLSGMSGYIHINQDEQSEKLVYPQ